MLYQEARSGIPYGRYRTASEALTGRLREASYRFGLEPNPVRIRAQIGPRVVRDDGSRP